MFDYVASLAPRRSLVWDCATGNGQAAVALAKHFDRVIATDASAEQIGNAKPEQGVEYRVAPADASGLPDTCADVITVAQALHWFPFERFYAEVRRVAAPGAVLVVWSYGACHAGDDVEKLMREFQDGTMGPYWNPGRKWVDEGYRTIPFPFEELSAPSFVMRMEWTLPQLMAYVRSWSSVASYQRERGADPVAPLTEQLAKSWSNMETREVTWPLVIRVGRVG